MKKPTALVMCACVAVSAAFGRKGYDKAIADFTKAIELDPANLYFNCSRGVAYFEKGDYDRAIADFETALRLDPNDEEVKNVLGKVRQLKQLRQ